MKKGACQIHDTCFCRFAHRDRRSLSVKKPPQKAASWPFLALNRSSSWCDVEFRVALEGAAGDYHFDGASGRAARNGGDDLGLPDDGKRRRRTIKRDARRT